MAGDSDSKRHASQPGLHSGGGVVVDDDDRDAWFLACYNAKPSTMASRKV